MIPIFWKTVLLLSIILLVWAVTTWFIRRATFRRECQESKTRWKRLAELDRRRFDHEDFGDQS